MDWYVISAKTDNPTEAKRILEPYAKRPTDISVETDRVDVRVDIEPNFGGTGPSWLDTAENLVESLDSCSDFAVVTYVNDTVEATEVRVYDIVGKATLIEEYESVEGNDWETRAIEEVASEYDFRPKQRI